MQLIKLSKRALIPLLTILLACILMLPSFAISFSDINGHWAEESILRMVEKGIVNGYEDGTFKPEKHITRIEFLTLVTRADMLEVSMDGEDLYWGKPYIDAAVEAGYILPDTFGSTSFDVYDMPITREEMASVIVRAYIARGLEIDSNAYVSASQELTDLNTVGAKYIDTTISAVALGLITGYPDETFKPKGNTRRSESTIVVDRYLTLVNGDSQESEIGGTHDFASDHHFSSFTTPFSVNHIEIGDPDSIVKETYGDPVRIDDSPYGFKWWVYHDDYFDYYMVGVSGNRVVALYTATDLLKSTTSLKMHQDKSQVTKALGSPVTLIEKGSNDYLQVNDAGSAVYLKDNIYLTAYFDTGNSGRLFSVYLIDKNVETSMSSLYGNLTDSLRNAFEQQVFDLNNVYRTEYGKLPLKWDEGIANTARKHSKDMADRIFFDHNNPSGQTPFDRIASDGIRFSVAAENIAAGYMNPFGAHAGWVNSPGHRDNLLRNIDRLGVGIYFGGQYKVYYTQNYYTAR